jgi:NAD(P)-dependent dehydrogenase (short-subunit alcohol dehydrogenase family)
MGTRCSGGWYWRGSSSRPAKLDSLRTLQADGITVNAVDPGYVATDLNNHGGHLTPEQVGATIARYVTQPGPCVTGAFLNENGATQPW